MSGSRAGIDNYLFHLLPHLVRAWHALPGEGGERRVRVFAPPGGIGVDGGQAAGQDRGPADGRPVDGLPDEVRAGGGPGWTQLRLPLAARGAAVYFSPIPILPQLLPMPCPAVVTVHDLHEFRPRWAYFRRLLDTTFRRAARIVCVSAATEAEVRAEFPWAAAKTTVIREAADTALFHPPGSARPSGSADPASVAPGRAGGGEPEPPGELLRRLGIRTAPLLAVGTLQPRKNYATLIRAYALLPEGAPPLVIVGKPGWEHEPITALPAELGLGDRVVFAGHVAADDLAALMRQAVLLCALSTAEGFGLPLVEAMASGLPILASDIPPFREVAGNAARFVPPTDPAAVAARLRDLLADPALRAEMSGVGLRRQELFSWERAGRAVVQELERARTGTLTSF